MRRAPWERLDHLEQAIMEAEQDYGHERTVGRRNLEESRHLDDARHPCPFKDAHVPPQRPGPRRSQPGADLDDVLGVSDE